MSRFALARAALSICSCAVLLAGCGGSQPPIGAPSAIPQSRAIAQHAARRGSWMLPKAKSEDLLYVTNSGHGSFGDGGSVYVFSYPKATLVGQLTAFSDPEGACVDGVGNVFVSDANYRQIFEYAHGGSQPVRTLVDMQEPNGCSIDPITGNLAVANIDGSVAIYRNAKGHPRMYHDPILIDAYYCAYDDEGNLFLDGFNYYNGRHNFQFAELPNGKRRFRNITLNETLVTPVGVQWDGKFIVVGDGWSGNHAVYRLQITGSEGIVKDKVSLSNALPEGFWIESNRLVNPDFFSAKVEFFKYPAGGSDTKASGVVDYPSAATVSRASR